MRITFDALTVLDAIDRGGSFAAAAEQLHRVPSAVTYAVQKLEEDLGIVLFDRSGHRAQLTPAGRELLREGRRLIEAADELEARVHRVATGYEVELRIALSDVIPLTRLYPLLDAFYREKSCGTRLRLLTEVYGGAWDALVASRADLVIGAPGEGPAGNYGVQPLGMLAFDFMVATDHPLAGLPEPLRSEDIRKYRAVSAADSSRQLEPRTSGLLNGQDTLTVPDMQAKIAAQIAGLGVGYIPRHLARLEAASGRLCMKQVEEPKPDIPLHVAWRSEARGKALAWFREQLRDKAVVQGLLA